MIFSPALARLIERDIKHQTRRPIQQDRTFGTDKPCRYQIGREYAVQPGRGHKATCHIRILDRRRETVGQITEPDAQAEGFKSIADFANYWMRLHDPGWPIMEDAQCPHCDPDENIVLDPATGEWIECPHCNLGTIKIEADIPEHQIIQRFRHRHAQTRVWVLTFERTDDQARYLAAGAPVAPSGKARLNSARKVTPKSAADRKRDTMTEEQARGYTPTAALAIDTAETVDDLELARQRKDADDRWAEHKRDKTEQARRDRERLALEQRIVALRRQSALGRIDVSSELGRLRRMLQDQRPREVIVQQLTIAERRAYREAA